jgi:ribosomal protein S18 acetylase RimI-like enzyme
MNRHILDRPVWNALSTNQLKFSLGGDSARRFAPNFGPLASARDDSAKSLSELAELVPSCGAIILLQADPIIIPDGVEASKTASGVQMVLESLAQPADDLSAKIEVLKGSDAASMAELAELTQPGPFEMGTPSLGEFWGIREDGKLLAMAGERMKHAGYTEVSGVCVHPNARGRGYARHLSAIVAAHIQSRGEIPYLHAYATNAGAIRLYESLGFRLRCMVNVAVLGRAPNSNR